MAAMDNERIEKTFLNNEIKDHSLYSKLAQLERDPGLRLLFRKLSDKENEHIGIWKKLLGVSGAKEGESLSVEFDVYLKVMVWKVFGISFLLKLLERNERAGVAAYSMARDSREFGEKGERYLGDIIKDESGHEKALVDKVLEHKDTLGSIQSMVFGLNDGLVEILALVAGLATVASTSLVVVIVGLIAGIAGTLSMSGGAYLSSKSGDLVEGSMKGKGKASSAGRAAYYTGIYYFIGALIVILPFLAGLKGIAGIILSVLFVAISLTAVSTIIAVVSDTSIKRRTFEMLAISLGAAAVTILFSTFVKMYLGVSI